MIYIRTWSGDGDLEPKYVSGGESGGEVPELNPSGVNVRIAGEEPRCPCLNKICTYNRLVKWVRQITRYPNDMLALLLK